jgi:ribosomal protein S19
MSEPIAETPSELPSIISTAVRQVIEQAKALGLTWSIRLATVATGDPLAIVYDGDTVVINAVSMIGPLSAGQRVYVAIVPSSGNFVIGVTETMTGQYIGMNVGTAGGLPAGSVGAEVAFPSASWNVAEDLMVLPSNRLFRIEAEIAPNVNDANANWGTFRIRQGQATTTGTVLGVFYVQYPAGFSGLGFSNKQVTYVKNILSSTIKTRLSLTVTRVVGAGTFSIYGGDSFAPTYITVQDIGPLDTHPLSDLAITLT